LANERNNAVHDVTRASRQRIATDESKGKGIRIYLLHSSLTQCSAPHSHERVITVDDEKDQRAASVSSEEVSGQRQLSCLPLR